MPSYSRRQASLRSVSLVSTSCLAFSIIYETARAIAAPPVATIDGMPPVVDSSNLYSEARAGNMADAVAGQMTRLYVPNPAADGVDVIDPATMKVVERYPAGPQPQRVVPSWDLRTLWVTSQTAGRADGSLTPLDPETGKRGRPVAVTDPDNLYFTPDGKEAIVVAAVRARLEFRDARTMAPHAHLDVPACKGIRYADFSIDGRYAIFTCAFAGRLAKVDTVSHRLLGYLSFGGTGRPEDVRISPDGKHFYVADGAAGGVRVIDGERFSQVDFIATGIGAHGLYPSRDGKQLYVANRGSYLTAPHSGRGSISVIDFERREVVANWPIPGGGSPDTGSVSADGKTLWLAGRFDDVVYAIDTERGAVRSIPVAAASRALTVWPQPGRYSLGYTGNMR